MVYPILQGGLWKREFSSASPEISVWSEELARILEAEMYVTEGQSEGLW